jgi:hypothetical protein
MNTLPRDARAFLWLAVLVGVALAWAGPARAQTYFTAGLGQGYLNRPNVNKWWAQYGYDYKIDERSNVNRFGVGVQVNKWLALEANYHDLGEYQHFAGFIAEEDQYDPATERCADPCPPTRWGYLYGNVYAFSLSALPTWQISDKWSLFGRVGAQWYHAKFKAYVSRADQQSRHWEENDFFTDNGSGVFYGVGITYDRLSFEVTQFPKIHANRDGCCSAYQDARTYLFSYRWDL